MYVIQQIWAVCTLHHQNQLHLHQVEAQGTTELAQFEAWFDCAAQIEASRRTSPEQVCC